MPLFQDDTPDDGAVLKRRKMPPADDLDITPMIDITFLLLIFFLVASIPDKNSAVDLAPARFGAGVSRQNSVMITVAESGADGLPAVYLAPGKQEQYRLPDDHDTQDSQIKDAVARGRAEGKTAVLIKAERGVKHDDVSRVAQSAAVEGMSLHLAVYEID